MKKAVIIVIVLLVLGAGFFIVRKITSGKLAEDIEPTPTIMAYPTISDDITVDFTARGDKKAVVLTVSGLPFDLESIEYELTYTTGSGLPRGVLGKIMIDGEKEITRDDIVLGTCSSGKCVYDSGVESINLSLKFNQASGIKIFQKTYSL